MPISLKAALQLSKSACLGHCCIVLWGENPEISLEMQIKYSAPCKWADAAVKATLVKADASTVQTASLQ